VEENTYSLSLNAIATSIQGLSKTLQTSGHDNRPPDRESNLGSQEYETEPRHLAKGECILLFLPYMAHDPSVEKHFVTFLNV
jgi:hypothetical protein